MNEETVTCPICDLGQRVLVDRYGDSYDCPRCGKYLLDNILCGEARLPALKNMLDFDPDNRARCSYWLAQHENPSDPTQRIVLTGEVFSSICKKREDNGFPLPNPFEQLNLLISWLGRLPHGKVHIILHCRGEAIIGATSPEVFDFVMDEAIRYGYLKLEEPRGDHRGFDEKLHLRLTMDGWKYYQNLQKGQHESRTAFMAMKFVKKDDKEEYDTYTSMLRQFKESVAMTGFTLLRLDERAEAGLIDDNMCAAIRNAAFVIADLSHGNHGAYWEAGFAEGLGKPVIYTYNQKSETRQHFDTNHRQTVMWDLDKLEDAGKSLKGIIRNTLPLLAKMEDDDQTKDLG